jgi:acyl-CoA thioesterase-1
MKIVRRYVGLLLILQLAAACSPETTPSAERRASNGVPEQSERAVPEKLVLAFGDSLYAGYGLKQDQSFPAVLERELEGKGIPAKVVNAGVSGDTTAGGRARLAFTLDGLERMPDLAVVGLGANDALRGIEPSETRRNLDAIVGELDKRGIPVLITGMMAPRNLGSAYVSSFDSIYPELANRYDAKLDPFILEGVITRPDLLLSDGMHPNDAGVRVMAARIAPMAAERLNEKAAN